MSCDLAPRALLGVEQRLAQSGGLGVSQAGVVGGQLQRLHEDVGGGTEFHLIGALSEYGKLGLTVIASSPEEVADLYGRTLDVLGGETGIGRA